MDQSESEVVSSSAAATEQMDGVREILERKGKTPQNKSLTRKGRRGAMRVTIEPEEPQEEEVTSTRRGRKGVTVVSKEPEDQEEHITKETSAAGRKRGRQTVKAKSVEEEEETPATKSRRGRRGKAVQTVTTSVSETPLKTVSLVDIKFNLVF